MKPCEQCGAKPNRAKKIIHKKGCITKTQTDPWPKSGTSIEEDSICKICGHKWRFFTDMSNTINKCPNEANHWRLCCNQPMLRTDGGNPRDVMCRHYRLLTDECVECRSLRFGVLIWRCQLCGRQVQDSPHMAQGNEALIINNLSR